MIENRIEGLWDCVYCGKVGIKARYDTCPSCGKPRGIENVFYLPDDIKAAILTRKKKRKHQMDQTGCVNTVVHITDQMCLYVRNVVQINLNQRKIMVLYIN